MTRALCSVRGPEGAAPDAAATTTAATTTTTTVERWHPETGRTSPVAHLRTSDGRTLLDVEVAPGEAQIFVRMAGTEPVGTAADIPSSQTTTLDIPIAGPWEAELLPVLDNRHGDFEFGGDALGVETWHVDTAATLEGPWEPRAVRDSLRFFLLGPLPAERAEHLSAQFSSVSRLDTSEVVSVDGVNLRWRPYRFSTETGIVDDPVQRDRMTGPHGLKSVSDDFLDPTVVDPEAHPGDVYLFWSAVDGGASSTERTVTISARIGLSVWIAGHHVGSRSAVPVHRFAPWNLRDARPNLSTEQITLAPGGSGVVVALTVADDQPSRAAVAIGGVFTAERPKSRLAWWFGSTPALEYRPARTDDGPRPIWVRAVIPPGATSVTVRATEPVIEARAGGVTLPASSVQAPSDERAAVVSTVTLSGAVGPLLIRLSEPSVVGREPVLVEPLRWQTAAGILDLALWNDLGLADYSGAMIYRASVSVPDGQFVSARLEFAGLVGTAAVRVDDVAVGIVFGGSTLDVTAAVRGGVHHLEIEVANTLANFAARLPSPFSGIQMPSGGFTAATLRLQAVTPHPSS
ncbi:hypothetical protein [Lacisediminihabitans changchengi]|uniref:Uncharacterized protein n=1 Tax=Lacisediminihabitans changchengi TaxID=2787634 RepID=A0A934SLY9_9MICO|nr:hypothetical protein [Lacisediminihabitans changchengi]MBK4347078.1 hypothetical protein [Lacisediminihabitans changchengi]MBK4347799.1 hypothetical protein [Lacisediminihabitans changchengi]